MATPPHVEQIPGGEGKGIQHDEKNNQNLLTSLSMNMFQNVFSSVLRPNLFNFL